MDRKYKVYRHGEMIGTFAIRDDGPVNFEGFESLPAGPSRLENLLKERWAKGGWATLRRYMHHSFGAAQAGLSFEEVEDGV